LTGIAVSAKITQLTGATKLWRLLRSFHSLSITKSLPVIARNAMTKQSHTKVPSPLMVERKGEIVESL
jgi:hypothetical protein